MGTSDLVILCGGKGTRLAPVIGGEVPKCLAPINGRPFLEYLIDYFAGQGIKTIVLRTNHLRGAVLAWMEIYKPPEGVVLMEAPDWEPSPIVSGVHVIANGDTMLWGDLNGDLRWLDIGTPANYAIAQLVMK